MLKPIKEAVYGEDSKVPHFSNGVIEYLQSRYNFTYLEATNHLFSLRQAGYSESYIMGYVAGMNFASTIIDMAVAERELQVEEANDTVAFK